MRLFNGKLQVIVIGTKTWQRSHCCQQTDDISSRGSGDQPYKHITKITRRHLWAKWYREDPPII